MSFYIPSEEELVKGIEQLSTDFTNVCSFLKKKKQYNEPKTKKEKKKQTKNCVT